MKTAIHPHSSKSEYCHIQKAITALRRGVCQTHYDYGANTFIAICVPTGIFTALFQHLLQFAMESLVNGCYISVCSKSRASACHFLVSSSASLEHVKKTKCCHENEMQKSQINNARQSKTEKVFFSLHGTGFFFFPEKNQTNVPGHGCHDPSSTSRVFPIGAEQINTLLGILS